MYKYLLFSNQSTRTKQNINQLIINPIERMSFTNKTQKTTNNIYNHHKI